MSRRIADDAPPEADRFDDAPHPRETTEFFGHAEAEAEFLDTYRSGRLPHAWIIGGPEGIGKATLAWRVARFLMAHPDPAAADVQQASNLFVPESHHVAHQIASLSHGDVFLLRREWNEKVKKHFTEIRIDDVRRVIHMFQRAAGAGGYRVCIVDCAEDLNRSGANALLKLIEEPPPKSLFLILAHRPAQVMATIRSRCRKLILRGLGDADMVAALKAQEVVADPDDLAVAISRARGSVREAMRLLGGGGADLDRRVGRLLDSLPQVDWREVHKLADSVATREALADYETMMASIYDWLDARVHAQAGEGARRLAPYAQVWEKVSEAARETEVLNLDKRALILSIFNDLAEAVRAANS